MILTEIKYFAMTEKFVGLTINFLDKPFEGIFSNMFLQCGNKNPCESGLVKVIPSDQICNNCQNIITPNWKQHWFSFFGPNPFVKFDFVNLKVLLTAYSLKTYSGQEGYGHLQSWIIQGSNDDENYERIDEKINSNDLNSNCAFHTYKIEEKVQPYRFIKITMTGKNHAGTDFMVIRNIEFFGTLSQ